MAITAIKMHFSGKLVFARYQISILIAALCFLPIGLNSAGLQGWQASPGNIKSRNGNYGDGSDQYAPIVQQEATGTVTTTLTITATLTFDVTPSPSATLTATLTLDVGPSPSATLTQPNTLEPSTPTAVVIPSATPVIASTPEAPLILTPPVSPTNTPTQFILPQGLDKTLTVTATDSLLIATRQPGSSALTKSEGSSIWERVRRFWPLPIILLIWLFLAGWIIFAQRKLK